MQVDLIQSYANANCLLFNYSAPVQRWTTLTLLFNATVPNSARLYVITESELTQMSLLGNLDRSVANAS